MATFSNAQALFGLQATAAPTGPNVAGNQTVGFAPRVFAITTTTVSAYSIRAISATTSNSFAVALDTGIATAVAGSPVITGGLGRDCEGVTLPFMNQMLRAIMITVSGGATQIIQSNLGLSGVVEDEQVLTLTRNSLSAWSAPVLTVNFSSQNTIVDIAIIASPL